MDIKVESGVEWTPKFIHDAAASDDFFGSHRRLATAMAKVIRTNEDVKIIGLLGTWGSGKSTVVKMFCDELEAQDSGGDLVFTYDAWLHQSDPPRRSFLENLLHFLSTKDHADEDKDWAEELDRLNRRIEENTTTSVPRLRWPGTLMVLSLLLTVFGAKFASLEWYKAAFASTAASVGALQHGTSSAGEWYGEIINGPSSQPTVPFAAPIFLFGLLLCLAPAFLGATFYFLWRPERRLWKRSFWTRSNFFEHRAGHEDDSILALYMNKETKTDYNRIIREPEPSTIEFQDTFRGIVSKTINAKKRLILIIDNLDRLPAEEALAMWATIRSFFLGADSGVKVRKSRYQPIVILPIAEDALARVYQNAGGDGLSLARSFMDKTFDLTFHVSRPVLTKWNEYLNKQMQAVFGEEMNPSWAFIASRLYDRFSNTPDAPPVTPRGVNTLINATAAQWLLWKDQVPFASVAYYCIYRAAIEKNVLEAVSDNTAVIKEFDDDWQASIAAMYYGVPRTEAASVLLEPPLRQAIAQRDRKEFEKVAGVAGFPLIIHRIVEDGRINPDAATIMHTAMLLGDLPPSTSPDHFIETWTLLRSSLAASQPPAVFGKQEADGLLKLFESCPAQKRENFLAACANLIASISSPTTVAPGFASAFAGFWKSVQLNDKSLLPAKIIVPGDAASLTNVALECGKVDSLRRRLDSLSDDTAITGHIVSLVRETKSGAVTEERINALASTYRKFEWSHNAPQITAIVRNPTNEPEQMRCALFVIGIMIEQNGWSMNDVKALLTDGSLANRLNEAYNIKNDVLMARVLGLLLLGAQPMAVPDQQLWPAMLDTRAPLQQELDRLMQSVGPKLGPLTQLVGAVRSTPAMRDIAINIASRWGTDGSWCPLVVKDVLDRLPAYLDLLNTDELKRAFIIALPGYETFWDEMLSRKLEGDVADAFETLLAAPVTMKRAQEVLDEHMAKESTEVWEAWIANGGKGFMLATSIKDGSGVRPALYEALNKTIPLTLASKDAAAIGRWFAAADLVDAGARIIVFKKLRDRIVSGSSVTSLATLMDKGGPPFIEVGEFVERADDSVRNVVVPLLENTEGRGILARLSAALSPSIENSESDIRDFVGSRLNTIHMEEPDAVEVRNQLLAAWRLGASTGESSSTNR
ncbi:P-loop NTPase fold protein [Dyella sp. Tek66A03]|uniref:P-loop NTPase fold protein n=1 Tax=Dyella sp. Tek66A03 TaxID=3458298 RepID=UPI00403E63E5